jgi:hypothetical protein
MAVALPGRPLGKGARRIGRDGPGCRDARDHKENADRTEEPGAPDRELGSHAPSVLRVLNKNLWRGLATRSRYPGPGTRSEYLLSAVSRRAK